MSRTVSARISQHQSRQAQTWVSYFVTFPASVDASFREGRRVLRGSALCLWGQPLPRNTLGDR